MSAEAEKPPARPYDLATAEHDQPEWFGPPRRTILLCSHPRSGSTMLGEALHFAGGLGCPLEYFHRGFRPSFERRWGIEGIEQLVASVHRHRTGPNGVLGVKLFWQDLEEIVAERVPGRFPPVREWPNDLSSETYRALWAAVADIFPSPDFILLERLDRVRQAASALAAMHSGQWRMIPGAEMPATGAPHYDYERMAAQFGLADYARHHWRRLFDAIGAEPVVLTYEALDRDYEGSVAALLRALGSDAAVPPRRMERQSDAVTEGFVLRFLRDGSSRGAS
ncbi:MAG TPA: Stf0 family sulfotransferase [Allosphingosinicella sp.]|nr:Stf0 family sulfotransferase [Allosphingosinicella sp.]